MTDHDAALLQHLATHWREWDEERSPRAVREWLYEDGAKHRNPVLALYPSGYQLTVLIGESGPPCEVILARAMTPERALAVVTDARVLDPGLDERTVGALVVALRGA